MSLDDYADLEKEIPVDEEEEVSELPQPVDWLSLSIHEWRDEMGRLRLWVGQIVTEWALPASIVPPCWEQHASIVQLLSALRDAYDTLYHEMQPGTGAVDWQRYWSWARAELASITAGLRCSGGEHQAEKLQKWARDLAEEGEMSEVAQGEDARLDLAVKSHLAKGQEGDALNVVFVDFTRGN